VSCKFPSKKNFETLTIPLTTSLIISQASWSGAWHPQEPKWRWKELVERWIQSRTAGWVDKELKHAKDFPQDRLKTFIDFLQQASVQLLRVKVGRSKMQPAQQQIVQLGILSS
jgi:hypothetical protein